MGDEIMELSQSNSPYLAWILENYFDQSFSPPLYGQALENCLQIKSPQNFNRFHDLEAFSRKTPNWPLPRTGPRLIELIEFKLKHQNPATKFISSIDYQFAPSKLKKNPHKIPHKLNSCPIKFLKAHDWLLSSPKTFMVKWVKS
jgi:hypothetical protein